jgi:DNA-binding cell septation regulator SpoVG
MTLYLSWPDKRQEGGEFSTFIETKNFDLINLIDNAETHLHLPALLRKYEHSYKELHHPISPDIIKDFCTDNRNVAE